MVAEGHHVWGQQRLVGEVPEFALCFHRDASHVECRPRLTAVPLTGKVTLKWLLCEESRRNMCGGSTAKGLARRSFRPSRHSARGTICFPPSSSLPSGGIT